MDDAGPTRDQIAEEEDEIRGEVLAVARALYPDGSEDAVRQMAILMLRRIICRLER